MTSDLGDEPIELDEFELVVLVSGSKPPTLDESASLILHRRHLGHLRAMRAGGHLKVAGPLTNDRDGRWRGLCLYQVGSLEEARRLASLDPAVVAGRFELEVMTWYCPKGEVAFPQS